ncbi:hypothetical protein G4177_11925 [Corallococcus sp. ZKHCc1 1396]|uniref:Lipoprotein n=1 Tax=Corallococcus soli TaxID=2710757 RepID=A0ABR9PLV9_9BACT|nr:hypothetical protein [Corallococcus soli]MBE4748869.1 hypothetical protein [Corallococcus soli]
MRKTPASSSVVWLALCTLLVAGCGGTEQPDPTLNTGGDNLGADTSDVFEPDGGTGPVHTGKVTVCHIPPGNPANAHTITVGAPALSAHLRHGDTLGDCDEGSSQDGGTSEPDAGSTDAGPGGSTDAGPVCIPAGSACDPEGASACCDGLSCTEGSCWGEIG